MTDRIEQAAPDVREVLEAAWNTIHDHQVAPWRKLAVANGVGRFRRFIDAEAYTDAALMLVPEGWVGTVGIGIGEATLWVSGSGPQVNGRNNHPALAIAAASLRAKGP